MTDLPTGPDLREGIDVSELADGGRIAGHVDDEAVVLARNGEAFFAFSAFCTHYHGPLAEGLIVGETIHCPWHHACFSMRTGVAHCAPAIRPLRVYETSRVGEFVRVGAEITPAAAQAAPGEEHIVIIGGGAAGAFAATELRRVGFGGRVTLLSRDERLPYDRPNLSKDYLAGKAPEEWMPLREQADYAAERIDLRLSTIVEEIDSAQRTLHLTGGEVLSFDRLIIATGASPRHLEIPIDAVTRVHYLRTWSDSNEIRAAAENARRVVIIGASFIGLEAAASLRERGLEVTVIGVEERPLEKVLGREIGDFIRRTHEQHGVRFRLGRKPVEIRAKAVVLDDGTAEACDFVIAGIGVAPELELARRAGLTIDHGIVVDKFLQTSAPHVFAAGDVARYPHAPTGALIRVEHWVAAGRQGQAAARNAFGPQEPFTAVPFFWSQHYDLVFAYVGHAERVDEVEMFGSLDEHNAAAVFRENGRISAVVTLFRDDVSLAVEAAMQHQPPRRLADGDDGILDLVRRAF
jgi:apoptosis-inducing factor 3